jgi:hypothetical protein
MIKAIFLVTVFFILVSACDKNENTALPISGEGTPAEELYDDLLDLYNNNDHEGLIRFLNSWEEEISSYRLPQVGSDIHKDVYQIFMEAYTPFDIGRLGEHEWGSEMYEGFDYAVVQNTIYFDSGYEPEGSDSRDSIVDFRPPVNFPGKKILYLTPNYHKTLIDFLQSDFNPLGTGGIMNPETPTEESAKRYQFLLQEIAIIPGHWGGYWHIETHPFIYGIHFNYLVNKAKASFRVGYMFGEAEFEKTVTGWVMTHSAITAIE